MATILLASIELPMESIAMLLGIGTIFNMARTATNVIGTAVVALLGANSQGEI
ncbi:cation:dicarboxylate symporter family transporter [Clostridium rectalis]|uniref:cation:dicarboxylate symporter family transporter n=1 Tax=Clostridium rectalis TaxID=2040295 RepID=UPI001FA9AF23|nr:cation:dicarboxylase symporter family transporter [Clostridium rectalis]